MTKSKAAQQFVPIKEIRDGVIILKDGSLRIILMASSLNFSLKSSDEQMALIMQYRNFLNSLDFSVQFFIQSRALNIEPYLDTLRQAEKEKLNDLIKVQIREYIAFIKNFVASTNIVSKTFYVVVTYTPPILETKPSGFKELIDAILGRRHSKSIKTMEEKKFEEYKAQLWQRVDVVSGGLASCGIRVVPLNTEEAIELFYDLFNPGELEKGKVPKVTT